MGLVICTWMHERSFFQLAFFWFIARFISGLEGFVRTFNSS